MHRNTCLDSHHSFPDNFITYCTAVSFTLRRVGYPALEYFSSSSSLSGKAVAEYAFLKAHVAVVEPSAPMELSLFHGEKESAYQRTYKFKVNLPGYILGGFVCFEFQAPILCA